ARRHEPDPGDGADGERPAVRRRAERPLHRADAEVARADLARARAEALELLAGQPDDDPPVDDADRGRHAARRAHAPLALEPDARTLSFWEAVRDDGRLERDDGPVRCERLPLRLAREDDVGPDPREPREHVAPARTQSVPRREVDAHARADLPSRRSRALGGARHRLSQERVAGEVEGVAAVEPRDVEIV